MCLKAIRLKACAFGLKTFSLKAGLLELEILDGFCDEMLSEKIEMSAPIEVARFMGRWFVVAQIPTPFDRGAKNSVEDYAWNDVRAPPPPPSPMPPPSSSP